MFDFCKLDVYQKAKAFCILITIISSRKFDQITNEHELYIQLFNNLAMIFIERFLSVSSQFKYAGFSKKLFISQILTSMMVRSIFFAFVFLSISTISNGQQFGTFTDPGDGITYKTIKIGTQIWMAENLTTSKFRNGDPIPEAKKDEEWIVKKAAWCYYDNNPKNGVKFGKLYNWYALMDPRGLAPIGWHIPSSQEWQTLATFLGGIEPAGTKMKSKSGWNENGNGSNESGFSGLPGSLRYDDGQFNDIGRMGYWWSTTPNAVRTLSYTLNLSNSYMGWGQGHANETYGFAIRCIKDK